MSWVTWAVIGAFAGVVARFPIKRPFRVVLLDVGLGVLGACLGGWSVNAYEQVGVTTLTPASALLAVLGAVVALALYHSVVYPRGRSTRQ